MLVYGDRVERVEPKVWLEQLRKQLADAQAGSGTDRHSKLVLALVEAGRLEQGLADAGRAAAADLNQFNTDLARCVVLSWESGYAQAGELPVVPSIEDSGTVQVRLPEGFAFYAVYPESFASAARKLRLAARPR